MISSLLLPSSPTAVFQQVAQIVIAPIQRQPRRSFTHVGEKVLETATLLRVPAGAYRDAATAVVLPRNGFGITTTKKHTPPGVIGRSGRMGKIIRIVLFSNFGSIRGFPSEALKSHLLAISRIPLLVIARFAKTLAVSRLVSTNGNLRLHQEAPIPRCHGAGCSSSAVPSF